MLPIADPDTQAEDLTVLRAFLARLGANDPVLDTVAALVARLLREQARLNGKLAALLRGKAESGTEQLGPEQLDLWRKALEEVGEPEAGKESDDCDAGGDAGAGDADGAKPPRGNPKRKTLPADLERRHVELPVEEPLRICAICGAEKACIGHETSEVLELEPARFVVLVYDRPKLACATCPESGVVVAPAATKPLDGGIPGPALLADVLIRKAVDHTPINRMLAIYRRLGVELPPNTVYGWWTQGAELLRPLAEAIHARVLASHLLQVDDTGIRVLDKDTPDGSRRGHMWGMVGDEAWVSYRYTKTWEGGEMAAFLDSRVGWLQGDGYKGYERLYRKAEPAIEVGCWSHARRYFIKAEESGDKRARRALVHIGELFAIEALATQDQLDPDARLALRRQRSPEPLRRLREAVARLTPTVTPRSPLGAAHTYLTNQWVALNQFLEDGRLPLENGAAERLARIVAVGRKNWLHCASDEGAERYAVLASVLTTARFQHADLAAGLAWAFDHLARRLWSADEAVELLPDRWPKEKVAAR